MFKIKDLLTFLTSEYTVTEYHNDPVSYIKVELPDFLVDEKKESEFWSNVMKLPTVK